MPAGVVDFAPRRFSTREIPERERVPMWREEFGRSLLRIDIEPLSDLPFHAEATLRALPGLRIAACTSSAVRLQRTPVITADGDDSIGMIVNLGESGFVSQRGRDVALSAGDAVALLHTEPATVTYAHDSHLALVLPRSALAPLVSNVDDATMRLIPNDSEPLRLLVNYLRLVGDELVPSTPQLRRVVVTHVHNLVALALCPDRAIREGALSAVTAARLSVALDHIAANFREPELSVEMVARNLKISPRYLQRLLETAGTSFTVRVNELRLQRAFTLLTEAGDNARRVSDIALEVGFSDISHFNHLFRSRFGDTPSGVRAQGRRAQ
jgi:AraC-like DNA-binding protein